MKIKGRCLCDGIEFEIDEPPHKLIQCHCSLCRKQGGSASNTALFLQSEQLRWLKGKELISSFSKPSGFRSDFCRICGSPVPNKLGNTTYIWVPAGLLENTPNLEVSVHLFLDSKAPWEPTPTTGVAYEEAPALDEIIKALHS